MHFISLNDIDFKSLGTSSLFCMNTFLGVNGIRANYFSTG